MKVKNNLCILIIFLLILSCKEKKVDLKTLNEYINDENNKLTKVVNRNDIEFKISFLPKEILMVPELKRMRNVNQQKIDSLAASYKDVYFFNLSFSMAGKSVTSAAPLSLKKELLDKFNYSFKDDVFVTIEEDGERDTLPILNHSYLSAFGVSNSDEVLISIDKNSITADNFYINIKNLFERGEIESIQFSKKRMENVLKLDFERVLSN